MRRCAQLDASPQLSSIRPTGPGAGAGRPAASAVAVLEQAARAVGADARVRQNLALAYALQGDWTAAKTIAAQDVPADQVTRIQQWMTFAKPTRASDQVAALTGITPAAADPGQPVRLALHPKQNTRQAAAEPVPAPVAEPEPVLVAERPAPAPVNVPPPPAAPSAGRRRRPVRSPRRRCVEAPKPLPKRSPPLARRHRPSRPSPGPASPTTAQRPQGRLPQGRPRQARPSSRSAPIAPPLLRRRRLEHIAKKYPGARAAIRPPRPASRAPRARSIACRSRASPATQQPAIAALRR